MVFNNWDSDFLVMEYMKYLIRYRVCIDKHKEIQQSLSFYQQFENSIIEQGRELSEQSAVLQIVETRVHTRTDRQDRVNNDYKQEESFQRLRKDTERAIDIRLLKIKSNALADGRVGQIRQRYKDSNITMKTYNKWKRVTDSMFKEIHLFPNEETTKEYKSCVKEINLFLLTYGEVERGKQSKLYWDIMKYKEEEVIYTRIVDRIEANILQSKQRLILGIVTTNAASSTRVKPIPIESVDKGKQLSMPNKVDLFKNLLRVEEIERDDPILSKELQGLENTRTDIFDEIMNALSKTDREEQEEEELEHMIDDFISFELDKKKGLRKEDEDFFGTVDEIMKPVEVIEKDTSKLLRKRKKRTRQAYLSPTAKKAKVQKQTGSFSGGVAVAVADDTTDVNQGVDLSTIQLIDSVIQQKFIQDTKHRAEIINIVNITLERGNARRNELHKKFTHDYNLELVEDFYKKRIKDEYMKSIERLKNSIAKVVKRKIERALKAFGSNAKERATQLQRRQLFEMGVILIKREPEDTLRHKIEQRGSALMISDRKIQFSESELHKLSIKLIKLSRTTFLQLDPRDVGEMARVFSPELALKARINLVVRYIKQLVETQYGVSSVETALVLFNAVSMVSSKVFYALKVDRGGSRMEIENFPPITGNVNIYTHTYKDRTNFCPSQQ